MKQKPTFLGQNRPLITCMIQPNSVEEAIYTARDGAWDGADAFGLQVEHLPPEARTEENLKKIFNSMGSRPVYVTNYRYLQNEGKSDDELLEGLLTMRRCGATLLDMMGDYYDQNPIQVTKDPVAIQKQKDAIARIHDAGGEVLMSSHVLKFTPPEEVLEIALGHQSRGADISKIVTAANSEEEELENLRAVSLLKKELNIPFLFLAGGTHNKLLRTIGPFMGVCMWLTVQHHGPNDTLSQPQTRAIRTIASSFDYLPEVR